ncbi:MAG: hypothetical protein ABW185_13055 [Sedimenticola sp.]
MSIGSKTLLFGGKPTRTPSITVLNTSRQLLKTITSMSTYIDQIPADEDVVVVIQMFAHALKFHHDIFEARKVLVRESVERLLQRNTKAVVAIKGPHVYGNEYGLDDYYGCLYRDIMFDAFKGLHDIVVYVDYTDMTSGR